MLYNLRFYVKSHILYYISQLITVYVSITILSSIDEY